MRRANWLLHFGDCRLYYATIVSTYARSNTLFGACPADEIRRSGQQTQELARVEANRVGHHVLHVLKDQVKELASTSMSERVEELKEARETPPSFEYHRKEASFAFCNKLPAKWSQCPLGHPDRTWWHRRHQ